MVSHVKHRHTLHAIYECVEHFTNKSHRIDCDTSEELLTRDFFLHTKNDNKKQKRQHLQDKTYIFSFSTRSSPKGTMEYVYREPFLGSTQRGSKCFPLSIEKNDKFKFELAGTALYPKNSVITL